MATKITETINKPESCTKVQYVVTMKDLPIHCPSSECGGWDGHPKVYIALQAPGDEQKCPYCGTKYKLVK